MTLAEMREMLAAEAIRLTRSLGQNFLHDTHQLRRIVALADPQPGSLVLEIGPGLGPLTEKLLESGARVVAVEKDARLAQVLRRRLGGAERLTIVDADALRWIEEEAPDLSEASVVANLPYSVASPLLIDLADLAGPPKSMTVTLQAEVVDRIRAASGSGDYGILGVLLRRRYEATGHFRIPAACFFPAPNVTSACVRLERRATPLVPDSSARAYREVVKLGFSQRRKRMQKVLRGGWSEAVLELAWKELGLDPNARAETLSPEVFAQLAMRLGPATGNG